MRKHTWLWVLAVTLASTTAWAQEKAAPSRPADVVAAERAAQLRATWAMNKFDVSQAVPYETVISSGNPGMLWIIAKEADTFEKRAHTALKAAEDLYNEISKPLIRVHLATIPEYADWGEFYQAVATYEAEKRVWRVFAHDGPAFPEWKIKITREWFDEADRVGGLDKINVSALQDRLGRLYNIQPSYIVPIDYKEINMVPYKP